MVGAKVPAVGTNNQALVRSVAMKFEIILAAGIALSVIAVSANAQTSTSHVEMQTGIEGGDRDARIQVGARPGNVISVTDRAARDTTLHSRAAVAVTSQPARVIADAAEGVVVAGEGDSNAKVFSDAGLAMPPSQVTAGGALSGSGVRATDAQ
jgi:hypothetical protein